MIDFDAPPFEDDITGTLLRDMNTQGNILFNGKELTLSISKTIKPRAKKSAKEKIFRTRTNAEVFTPSHVVKFMVDALDDGQIDSRWLEIACGEAPFITNRYDAESGEKIPINQRAGILDRKIRAAKNFDEAKRAVQSVYGYELQGDSLFIARANILLTFADHVKNFSNSDLAEVAEIIAWNFFQFDATAKINPLFGEKIVDWRTGRNFVFGGNTMPKFDFVISNPPYQDDTTGDNKTFAPPVYNKIMDAGFKIADKAVFITPARFLFDAGATPKDWNKKMLNDPHFKVLDYAPNADKFFKNVDIKGGVAITLRDKTKNFGAIGIFTPFPELNEIHRKVCVDNKNFMSLNKIMFASEIYHFTDKMHEDFPDAASRLSKGHAYDFKTNVFEKLFDIFLINEPNDGHEYIKIFGVMKLQRVYRFIRRDYVNSPAPLEKFKVLLPKSNGSGALGEVVSTPLVGTPLVGTTQTFITVGAFDTRSEAEACLAYIKSKFARAMLGILKVTQDNPPSTWAKVPLQDFTARSDIDWRGKIDEQLYKKYNLSAAEIKFIEEHVKAME